MFKFLNELFKAPDLY